ncbi:RloB family protein [Actinomyces sp. S4-C9]|uniref:RloB family protein n=1 Tax=Actinomyces sp. S4-C9 TaxID=1219581 RepID=UPI00050F17C7|nr:RloB family protein [Actinomyces sp. S4-C9]KGF01622.1 hypothetical protein HMPREF1628_04715 [Actinomyces sp. S4-C9]
MSRGVRGRKVRKQRKMRPRVLVVVEGSKGKSEEVYFQRLDQELRYDVALTVVAGAGEPTKVLDACNQRIEREASKVGDGSIPFDYCFLVMDEDNHPHLNDVLEQCRQLNFDALVTNPKFELWLLWHVEDCKFVSSSVLDKRVKSRSLVSGKNGKELAGSFPVKDYAAAVERAKKAWREMASNEVGPNPSSGIPVYLEKLDAISSQNKK